MKERTGELEEEQEQEAEERPPAAGDLGAILMGVQDSAGNAALAGLVAQVESGQVPPEALLAGNGQTADKDAERERQGIKERATHMALSQRLTLAKGHPRAKRIAWRAGLVRAPPARRARVRLARHRRGRPEGRDVRARGQAPPRRAPRRRRSPRSPRVDLRRKPISERLKKAILESTAIAKPGMALYAPEDFEALDGDRRAARRAAEGAGRERARGRPLAPDARQPQRASRPRYASTAAANLAEQADKAHVKLIELELELSEILDRHARANAEDREKLNQLMEGLEPRLRREPRLAMAGGSSAKEIDYLIKKAWLEQHEQTQQLAKDEVWELVAGFSPDEGKVAYFDLPERMGQWRIHLSLDYGVMRAVDVECSESDIRDAIMGGGASVVLRSHATAEVLGRSDDRNPHYYYGTGKVTPKRDFWTTREGKAVKRNWSVHQGELMDAFDTKADEFVKVVAKVLEQRKELKAIVVKVGETLQWAELRPLSASSAAASPSSRARPRPIRRAPAAPW